MYDETSFPWSIFPKIHLIVVSLNVLYCLTNITHRRVRRGGGGGCFVVVVACLLVREVNC